MKSPLIPRSRSRRAASRAEKERGVTMILVALSMVAIIAMAALSIDVVTLYLARDEAQRAADEAALAGAKVLAISGVTSDPGDTSSDWATACSLATSAATTVGEQNAVGGTVPTTVTVSFLYNGTTTNCSAPSAGFGINPQVQVVVQRTGLPVYFSRIWSRNSNTITATAVAEAFNPSGSGSVASQIVPVNPRCVKPWMVPNFDPMNPAGCTTNCTPFVDRDAGTVDHPGISLNGTNANGVIGERFWLTPDCQNGVNPCTVGPNPPQANYTAGGALPVPAAPPTANLQYVPGEAPSTTPAAVPSCSTPGSASPNYEPAIAGCDQTTVYACGQRNQNRVELIESPGTATNDTLNGVQCLIHAPMPGLAQGQDVLDTTAYPFKITAGANNPLVGPLGTTPITTSNSIVTIPIYDSNRFFPRLRRGVTDVTVVGFLQVFINQVDGNGDVDVTVLNVSGCGNGTNAVGAAVTGSSPVPVRLITSP
jgi:Flp pilus assembly protein TadG